LISLGRLILKRCVVSALIVMGLTIPGVAGPAMAGPMTTDGVTTDGVVQGVTVDRQSLRPSSDPPSPPPPPARPAVDLAPGQLGLTLTRVTPWDSRAPGPCQITLTVDNRSRLRVRTFAVSLLIYDPQGTLLRQVSVLTMPLRPGRQSDVTVPVLPDGCARLGSLRVFGFPWCHGDDGRRLNCRAAMVTASHVPVPLSF